jgi:hypothetical protein
MEATYSYETSADFQRTTRRYIPEDRTLHNQRCENLEILHNEEQYTVVGISEVEGNFKIYIKFEGFKAVTI